MSESGPITSGDVGKFVIGDEALGFGRLAAITADGLARVRYFRCPAEQPYEERECPVQAVRRVELHAHTRVYLSDAQGWKIGRVTNSHPQFEDQYIVAFPNSEGAVLPEADFEVRWALPIENPYEVLAVLGGDSPKVYEPRLALINAWHSQKAAAQGVEGLLLGSVELHEHQLSIVRRVTDDDTRRYLLADEVGLGKTIEAGALIWQYLSANPSARILVLAPDHLRIQWAEELVKKFRVDDFTSAWLRIRAHDDLESWPDESVDMLVVDEAHHLTRAGVSSPATLDRLAVLAHDAEDVLLLTATPVRSNEVAFLDLLHLLDPANYDRDDVAAFTKRVELRDQLALTHAALVPELDAFDVSLYSAELTKQFPEDQELAFLLDVAAECEDEQRPEKIAEVRQYLSETYRLHHRLLRTRRASLAGNALRVRGRGRGTPFTLEIDDESDALRRDLLDSLRIHLAVALEDGSVSEAAAVTAFRDVAERCGSLPVALEALLKSTEEVLDQSTSGEVAEIVRVWVDDHGKSTLESIQSAAVSVNERFTEQLASLTLNQRRSNVLVMSSFTESATVAAAALSEAWGDHRVATHLRSNSREDNAHAVARWQDNEDQCAVLFCDPGAEEGMNLQNAELMVHLDLPWESLRLEQRLGRCDRYSGRNMQPIASTVITYGEQAYAMNWFGFLADGCRVFDRSVSSLQYVLADSETKIQASLLTGGSAVLSDAIESQVEQLEREGTRIAAHDSLDSIESNNSVSNGRLLASDQSPALVDAFRTWYVGVSGGFTRVAPDVVELRRKSRPQVPFPLELAIAPSIGKPLAIARPAAVDRADPLLRAGHPLLDAVLDHLEGDDRGIAFAYFRPTRGQWPPRAVFRTDYLVLPGPNSAFVEAAAQAGLGKWALQQLESSMPPQLETVFMLDDGTEVDHPSVTRPYDKRSGDSNLTSRPEMFAHLAGHLDWSALCLDAATTAETFVRGRSSSTVVPKQAAVDMTREVRRREREAAARSHAGLPSDKNDLQALIDAVPSSFEQTRRAIGCGVILLGDPVESRVS